jgi:hypothetical protein
MAEPLTRDGLERWDFLPKANRWEPPVDNAWTVVARKQKPTTKVTPQTEPTPAKRLHPKPVQQRTSAKQPQGSRSPRKWHAASGGKQPPRSKPLPRLVHDSDNDAEAAWRRGDQAVDQVHIPDALILKERGVEHHHERLAEQNGAFIHTYPARSTAASRIFGIWGAKVAVAATKKAILGWIDASGLEARSARATSFARPISLNPVLRERAEKRWERDVKKQMYRQHPPYDMTFGAIGTFHWPATSYKPEEALGNNYEAFDPIRMDCSCYVVYLKETNVFRVMGKPKSVLEALQRIRATCFQIAAKQFISVRQYLLYWPEPELTPDYVYLEDYEPPSSVLEPGVKTAIALRKAPACDETKADKAVAQQAEVRTHKNTDRLRTIVHKALSRLHHYRGHIQVRIRLGKFLVNRYREPGEYGVYDLQPEFESMLQASQFSGEVTQEYVAHEFRRGRATLSSLD